MCETWDARSATLRTQPTLVAEQVTAHLVDSRVTPCARRTAEEASLSASGSDRKRRDDRVIHYLLILSGAMASSAQKNRSDVKCLRRVAW